MKANEKKGMSRRDFLKGTAAGALGVAAAGMLGGVGVAKAEETAAPAEKKITWDDILATSYSQANRRSNPDAKAPETPEEFIIQKGNGDILGSMMVGMVGSLGIPESQFMNNKPAWLGDEPDLSAKVAYTKECEVLVIGAGQAARRPRCTAWIRAFPPFAAKSRRGRSMTTTPAT